MSWDSLLEPCSGHGVTTVVTGNCGVDSAPVRPGREEWLIKLMEGVEDIPGTALTEGITWGWESCPEHLDAIGNLKFAIDLDSQVAHGGGFAGGNHYHVHGAMPATLQRGAVRSHLPESERMNACGVLRIARSDRIGSEPSRNGPETN
jgi:hypothetical protein